MYCVKCGVELADSEKLCPLCKTEVVCPGESRKLAPPPYPAYPGEVREGMSKSGILFLLTSATLIALVLCLLIDLDINKKVVWSGFACGGILLGYIVTLLPFWFKKPNPVVFVPCNFAATGLYLFYINFATNGNWFLSFVLPLLGASAILMSAITALLKYTKGGELYIFGGGFILSGGLAVLAEFLITITFNRPMFKWSLYPLAVAFILGMTLIVIGICKPLRESLKKRFFI